VILDDLDSRVGCLLCGGVRSIRRLVIRTTHVLLGGLTTG
jgi:hypothetical protein